MLMSKTVIAEQTHKWVERCDELNKENKKLKELLKESKIYIENFIESSTTINDHHISYFLLQQIKEVLK